MMRNIHVAGADQAINNKSGDDYAAALQLTTGKTKVFNLAVTVLTAAAADRVIYLFDTAAGSASTANPKVPPLIVGYGLTGVLDFPSGVPFSSGVYLVVGTDEVADGVTAPTAGSANEAIVTVSLKEY